MNIVTPVFAAWPGLPVVAGALSGAFVAGCLTGSFLNVVVHRVPRGETVVFGRSRCPACRATIRARDNVPVLGWLLLRGRCRDCGAGISARYPLIEAACGLLAVTLAAIELAMPGSDPQSAAVAWGGRFAVVMTLVAWSLLAASGYVVSALTVGVAAAAAALTSALIPALRPLAAGWSPGWAAGPDAWLGCLAASALGMVVGWVAGGPGGRASRNGCILVGAALGWQAAVLAAAATAVGLRSPAAASLAVVVVVGWRPLGWAWETLCAYVARG